MTALQDTIELGLTQIESIQGDNTFTFDEESFPCHVGTQTVSSVLETGGLDETQQNVLVVRKSAFTDGIYPQEDEKITLKEVVYYVETVSTDPTDTFLNIVLKKTK